MLVPLALSSISALALSILTYHPYQKHLTLHGLKKDPLSRPASSLNLESCEPVYPNKFLGPASAAEPAFCDDVVLHHQTKMAYMSCDPGRLGWDARMGVWEDEEVKEEGQGEAAIWAWDTSVESLPRKLFIKLPLPSDPVQPPKDLLRTFHPSGLAVTYSHPHYSDQGVENPAALVILVANHPKAHEAGVVDVFVHNLDSIGGRNSNIMRWIRRIEGDSLKEEERRLSPFRMEIFDEQHSKSLPRDGRSIEEKVLEGMSREEYASAHVRIPSFLFTSLALPTVRGGETAAGTTRSSSSSSVIDSYLTYAKALMMPTNDLPPQDAFIYHANANVTMNVLSEGSLPSWRGFPPLIKATDGGGKEAGSNSSLATFYASTLSGEESKISEWTQHWVKGIRAGIKEHLVESGSGEGVVGEKKTMISIKTYTPQFVTFWRHKLKRPLWAIGSDRLGRIWAAYQTDTIEALKWIDRMRQERRTRIRGVDSSSSSSQVEQAIRPTSRIDQITYIYKNLNLAAAHPWELTKVKQLKEKGLFLRKEFHQLSIFVSESQEQASRRGTGIERHKGFLPSIVTGIAVDHERGFLIVVGAYEERGIAKCVIPERWAEM
ncbi:hypothetical protein IE53DRAFT_329474 [Violaceomyces palustris]|uniref:Uncharacterized protein n=1 Tax=Violaceomyces palustris TaxID=1673888 RepID=A0ACD0NYF0_9BASI|nr:hypothetical protein IE53DRAFT_329474 [Violaceomyces palustris]